MYETILFEKAEGVASIALNRPEKLNVFDGKMHEELRAALDLASRDDEIRCVLLRGEGRGFSAGADLSQIVENEDGGPDAPPDLGEYLRGTYNRLVAKMSGMEKPLIAALHGPVYGAGLGISLACDLRVAAESAKFSVAFVKIGLMPDAGVSFFLPRVIGLGRAMEMAMLGDALDADEAYRIGLINRVVPGGALLDEANMLARRLAAAPTTALGEIKHAMYASFESDLATALEQEAQGQARCGYTEDHKEGVAAFFEKREARFTGR